MVNPDRVNNAIAALDILARADASAFERGRNMSGPVEQDAVTIDQWREGSKAAHAGKKWEDNPYPVGSEKSIAWYNGFQSGTHGKERGFKDSTRGDAADSPYEAGRAARRAGKSQTECPSKRGSPNGQQWLAGWQKEHEDMRSRGDATTSIKAGDYVRHDLSGRVGKVIEAAGGRALVRWNADGTESPAKLSDLTRMDATRGDATQSWAMPDFEVTYTNAAGKNVSVKVRAENARDAEQKLRSRLGKEVDKVVGVKKVGNAAAGNARQRGDKLEPAKPGTPGFGRNIAREIEAGKPPKQAEAIAYSKARGDANAMWKIVHDAGHFMVSASSAAEARQKAAKDTRLGKHTIKDVTPAGVPENTHSHPLGKPKGLPGGVYLAR